MGDPAEAACDESCDLAVVGAGAAGLFAAIWAARTSPAARVVALDGARRLGAKILVAGGGRCNVTHWRVDERDYNGSTPAAIRRVLTRFSVERTIDFFQSLGVRLKREETGKLFPETDDAHSVLDALLGEARRAGVELRHPARVHEIRRAGDGFEVRLDRGWLRARRVILATGGRALPKSGSDGAGFEIARSLGHSVTRLAPALVPLILQEGHWIRSIPGVASDAEVVVRERGRVLRRFHGAVLCTHFGLSGPAILDASRHLLLADAGALAVRWLPSVPDDRLDAWLLNGGADSAAALGAHGAAGSIGSLLRRHLPERLARAACMAAGVDFARAPRQIRREARARLAAELAPASLPVTGSRGDTFAEATAGGIPLREVNLATLESRVAPGLHLCGEILDVDGRIGGFNFQWAWSSGFVAGTSALHGPEETLAKDPRSPEQPRDRRT